MKKLLLNFVLLISLSAFSQTTTPFIIEHCKDKMTDKEYFFSQKKLICANTEKTKGLERRARLGSYIWYAWNRPGQGLPSTNLRNPNTELPMNR